MTTEVQNLKIMLASSNIYILKFTISFYAKLLLLFDIQLSCFARQKMTRLERKNVKSIMKNNFCSYRGRTKISFVALFFLHNRDKILDNVLFV